MNVDLTTEAEKHAEKAERLSAFLGISLLNIKQKVAELLSLIGRGEIFDQYTRHDISHVNKMLAIIEWLVPANTKEIMSSADWLLIVLAIYFHDLGMLVTKKEYESRNLSGFPEYRDKVLFAGSEGEDYRAKINEQYSNPDQTDRFLYQEFVRYKHAERIRTWIMGKAPESLGITQDVMLEVDKLLEPLTSAFRRDLALVCESHHLDDLNDFKKYRVSQPYGDSDEETANLQYAAALLRTADLLNITSDRTPSIIFRTINPTDPLSQEEWAKQKAVTRVRSQIGRDREGISDENAPRDTIEIFANFDQEDGFFGLTSYLSYAADQIRRTYDWVKAASKYGAASYEFPWRYIDDSNIETAGFMRDTFEFTIDQAKILDLLTGHTLYNDTNVVIRELVQNSLDAVRLQHFQDKRSQPGKVLIHWNSKKRVLSVEDNGTGMTQDIIERHLLKVGASRYQDAEFRKQYPSFSSISRFGIGVLSTFMVADNVEVTTCHPDEDRARQISLRSVHGKYLIRLLDKESDEVARRLAPHGTLIKLSIRPSAQLPNFIESAERWIVLPNCDVFVTLDDAPPVRIGYKSPKEALEAVLDKQSLMQKAIQVEQKELNGITLAYAVEWSAFFQEWTFLRGKSRLTTNIGTCIEGIRVEFDSPGYKGTELVALANATGLNAPKTNVARSGLEVTPELMNMLQTIYSIYCNHIKEEMHNLYNERSFSLTWAAQESRYLLSPLIDEQRDFVPVNWNLLSESIRELPLILVEQNGQRLAYTPKNIRREPYFWTIDCAFFSSAEWLIREVSSQVSLSSLINALHEKSFQLPEDPVLCGLDTGYRYRRTIFEEYLFENKEVDIIRVSKEQRRLDLRWAEKGTSPRWIGFAESALLSDSVPIILRRITARRLRYENQEILIQASEVQIDGLTDEIGVQTLGKIFLKGDSDLACFIMEARDKYKSIESIEERILLDGLLEPILIRLFNSDGAKSVSEDQLLDDLFSETMGSQYIDRLINILDIKRLISIFRVNNPKLFTPSVWQRNQTWLSL